MAKKVIVMSTLLFIFSILITSYVMAYPVSTQPEYAKWGRLAMIETHKRYPNADIIDYLHIGREQISPTIAEERFKLWLRENQREFGVFVNIQFDTNTEEVKKITFRETSR